MALLLGLVPVAAAQESPPHAPVEVPSAIVTGPIPVTGDSTPWLAEDIDLASRGYVEQEYFITGTARRYATDDTGTAEE